MKIKLIIEDKNKNKLRRVTIPISKDELSSLVDIAFFMSGKEFSKWFKLNKIKPKSIFKKIWFALYDVVDDGKCYTWEKNWKKGKLCKERWYLVKKPKWRNGKTDR